MPNTFNDEVKLMVAAIGLVVCFVLALSTIVMCIVFEYKLKRKGQEKQRTRLSFDDEVNEKLEPSLDIKRALSILP